MLIVHLQFGVYKPSVFSWAGHQPYPINYDSLSVKMKNNNFTLIVVRCQTIIPAILNHTSIIEVGTKIIDILILIVFGRQ